MGLSGDVSELRSSFIVFHSRTCSHVQDTPHVSHLQLSLFAQASQKMTTTYPGWTLCHTCALSHTRNTEMHHANFTQLAILERSTEALHPGCRTHRHECKSSQILGFGSVVDQTQLDLGTRSQQSEMNEMKTFLTMWMLGGKNLQLFFFFFNSNCNLHQGLGVKSSESLLIFMLCKH